MMALVVLDQLISPVLCTQCLETSCLEELTLVVCQKQDQSRGVFDQTAVRLACKTVSLGCGSDAFRSAVGSPVAEFHVRVSPQTELTAYLWAQLWLMLPPEMTVVHIQDWVAKITSIPLLRALAPDLFQGQARVLR